MAAVPPSRRGPCSRHSEGTNQISQLVEQVALPHPRYLTLQPEGWAETSKGDTHGMSANWQGVELSCSACQSGEGRAALTW